MESHVVFTLCYVVLKHVVELWFAVAVPAEYLNPGVCCLSSLIEHVAKQCTICAFLHISKQKRVMRQCLHP